MPMQQPMAPAAGGGGAGKKVAMILGILVVLGGLGFAGWKYGWPLIQAKMGGGEDLTTPDGTVRYVINGLSEERPEVLWDVLPPEHQQTINDELKKSFANVDEEIHKESFAVLQKAVGILRSKKSLVMKMMDGAGGSPGGFPGGPGSPGGFPGGPPGMTPPGGGPKPDQFVKDNWDDILGFVDILLKSKVSDPAWIKDPDVALLLKEDGAALMKSPFFSSFIELSAELSEQTRGPNDYKLESWEQLKEDMKAHTVRVAKEPAATETTATVEIVLEKDGVTHLDKVEMQKAGERWLPKEVAVGLDKFIADVKKVNPLSEQLEEPMTDEQKQATVQLLKSVNQALDEFEKVNTEQELMGAVGLVMGQLGGQFQQWSATMGMGGMGGLPGMAGGGGPNGFPQTGGANTNTNASELLPGLPALKQLPVGRTTRWTYKGGNRNLRVDLIYLNKTEDIVKRVFGDPDAVQGAYWIYNNMNIRNVLDGGTMKTLYFGFSNGVVTIIEARP